MVKETVDNSAPCVIFKYPLELVDEGTFGIRGLKTILHIEVQNDELQLWALIDRSKPTVVEVPYKVKGTGHAITVKELQGFRHFQSVQQIKGGKSFIWHVMLGKSVDDFLNK